MLALADLLNQRLGDLTLWDLLVGYLIVDILYFLINGALSLRNRSKEKGH